MKTKTLLAAVVLGTLSTYSWAAGKVVFEAGTEEGAMQSSIEFDGDRIRMDIMGLDMEAYMLMRDGRAYAVAYMDGQPFVMDLSSLSNMLSGGASVPAATGEDINELIALDSTGRTETVAGVTGDVYIATYTDANGRRQTDEIVIGSHAALREMTESMMAVAEAMSQESVETSAEATEQLLSKGDGVLRFGNSYRIVSLESSAPDMARFELPAEPQQMPSFAGMLGGGVGNNGNGEAEGEGRSNPISRFFGRQADRQQNRVERQTERETDRAADEAVDGVVDRAFRLFRR